MPPLSLRVLLALSFLSLLTSTATTTTTTTTIGITYNPSSSSATTPNFPTPEQVASTLINTLRISAVQLFDPTPAAIRAFSYSNISLLLTLPNRLISSFADNRSNAAQWVYTYVLPFHPRARISLISLGSDVVSSPSDDPTSDPSTALLPAMRNLQQSLHDLGLRNIPVSTSFSYIRVMTTTFPPSSSEFQEPISSLLVRPVLQFLHENNSSFLIDVHPYNVYRLRFLVPVGFALFQDVPYNFRDDAITGARYRNLFDMMVDGVITALAIDGYQDLPVVVTQTGWPSSSSGGGGEGAGAEVSQAYARMYLNGLIAHLRSGLGTPLKKDAVAQVYMYDLFDGGNNDSKGERWGILNPNLTMKFKVDFSSSAGAFAPGEVIWFHVLVGMLVWKLLMIM